MASHTNSDDDVHLAWALRLSLLSASDFDDEAAQPVPKGSATASHTSRQTMPPSDEKDHLALALKLSQLLPFDEVDEEVSRLDPKGYVPAGEAHPTTPSFEDNEGDLELALKLSQLPADLSDEQVMELNRQNEGRTSINRTLTSSHTAIFPSEVRT
jgi:hypothetical protein